MYGYLCLNPCPYAAAAHLENIIGDMEGNYSHVPFQTKPPLYPPTSGSVWGAMFNHSTANLGANLGLNNDQNKGPERIRRRYM